MSYLLNYITLKTVCYKGLYLCCTVWEQLTPTNQQTDQTLNWCNYTTIASHCQKIQNLFFIWQPTKCRKLRRTPTSDQQRKQEHIKIMLTNNAPNIVTNFCWLKINNFAQTNWPTDKLIMSADRQTSASVADLLLSSTWQTRHCSAMHQTYQPSHFGVRWQHLFQQMHRLKCLQLSLVHLHHFDTQVNQHKRKVNIKYLGHC